MRRRRATGSVPACHAGSASLPGRAYFASDLTEVCPDSVISIGVDPPSSAAWVDRL